MCRYDTIIKIKNGSSNRLRETYISKNNKDIYNEIINYTKNLDIPFKQRIWHWVNNEPNYITCQCGKRVSFKMNWEDGYKKYCSNKCSANSRDVRNKYKETVLENWGVDHYSKTSDYKEKIVKTSQENWGVDNYSLTQEYKIKSKQTYNDKWGVDNFTQTNEYKEKSKQTYLENWGVDHYSKTKEFKDKFRKSMIEKYGVDSFFKSDENRNEYNNSNNLFNCDSGKNHTFEISTDNYYGRLYSNNNLCTVCNPISDLSSIKEKMLYEFISENYSGEIIRNYKDKWEIDIYLPELKLGFEFNGLYWHSDKFKSKWYHIDKLNYFKEKEINIIHIWEDDWVNNSEIIKSQILYSLDLIKDKIFARKCKVKEIKDINIIRDFLNKNHIQGFTKSSFKLGLYYNDELVSIMTFDHFEGRKKMFNNEWNLNRFCTLNNKVIVGAASKLLKNFIKIKSPNRIISYADKNWSSGYLYYKLGFDLIGDSNPDYKYVINGKRIHKSHFKNAKIDKPESSYIKENNIIKIWDCGKLKFEMKKAI